MPWTRVVEAFLFPPMGPWTLALLGWIVMIRRRRLGQILILTAFSSLYLFMTPFLAAGLQQSLDRYPPFSASSSLPPDGPEAIVILGAGDRGFAAEFPARSLAPTRLGQERLEYGVWLHRGSGSPILVSGFSAPGMAERMDLLFGIRPRWVEEHSRNTLENARYSADLLLPEGVSRIYLVSHFWHMPRAVDIFERSGFEVTPAPMGFADRSSRRLGISAFLPTAGAAAANRNYLHELAGGIWYRWYHSP